MQTDLFDPHKATASSREISPAVLELLGRAVIKDNTLLAMPQVEREVYEEFDEILKRLRGQWVRNKGHRFPYDPTAALAAVIASGRAPTKNPLAYFPTPDRIATEMIELAQRETYGCYDRILEPSAGGGSLIAAALEQLPVLHVTAIEFDPLNVATLRGRSWPRFEQATQDAEVEVIEGDFLVRDFGDARFDMVLMNPPFNKEAWIAHIKRAWSLVAESGVLAAVVPLGIWQSGCSRRHVELRSWLDSIGAGIVENPDDSFAESGTKQATGILIAHKYPERYWTERHGACASLPAWRCWVIAECNREWGEQYDALCHLPAEAPEVRKFLHELAVHTNKVEQGGVPVGPRLLEQLAQNWGEE